MRKRRCGKRGRSDLGRKGAVDERECRGDRGVELPPDRVDLPEGRDRPQACGRGDAEKGGDPISDGRVLWTRGSAVGIVESNCLQTVWISQRDVTARKHAEEEMRKKGEIRSRTEGCCGREGVPWGSWSRIASRPCGSPRGT